MFEVLVPVDDSPSRAVAQADAVAALPLAGAVHAVVLHVFEGGNPEAATVSQVAAVRRARDHLADAGVEVSLAGDSGDPAGVILERAGALGVDLITVAGRKRSPAGKLLLGSVSQSVLRRADRPVLFCSARD